MSSISYPLNSNTLANPNTALYGGGSGPVGGVSQIVAGSNITISPVGGTGVVTVNGSAPTPGETILGTANQITATGTSTVTLALAAPSPAPAAGAYTNPSSVTVDGLGRVTAITAGTTPVDVLGAGYNLALNTVTGSGATYDISGYSSISAAPVYQFTSNLSTFTTLPNVFGGSFVSSLLNITSAPTITGAVSGAQPCVNLTISFDASGNNPFYGCAYPISTTFTPNDNSGAAQNISPVSEFGLIRYNNTQTPSTSAPKFFFQLYCTGCTAVTLPIVSQFFLQGLINCVLQNT